MPTGDSRHKNSTVLYSGISVNSKPRLYSNYCEKGKSFPSHMGPQGVISISVALRQTPAYTVRPRIRG